MTEVEEEQGRELKFYYLTGLIWNKGDAMGYPANECFVQLIIITSEMIHDKNDTKSR